MRGVAALSVALFHVGGPRIFGHGYLAVDFFFMLSGFVLAHAYGDRLKKPGSLRPFLVARLIRLYPMLILGTAFGFILAVAKHDLNAPAFPGATLLAALTNALGLPAIWDVRPFRTNGPTWSLFFEILANVLMGVTAVYATSRRLWASAVLFLFLVLVFNSHYEGFDFGWLRSGLVPGVARVGASFSIGMILYRLHVRGFLAEGGKRWWTAPLLVMSFALVPTDSAASVFYDPLVVFGLYPFLILATAGSRDIIPPIARLSGDLSYPFYILHVPLFGLAKFYILAAGFRVSKPVTLLILAAIVGVTWVILKQYDEPVRSYLKARLRRPSRDLNVAGHLPS